MADRNYVDKKRFFEEIKKYKSKYEEAEASGKPLPRANDYIGKAIWDIANRTSFKHSFIRYPFREEMVGNAVEACVKALPKFDVDRSEENPFGFFTRAVLWSFYQTIEAEHKKLYAKHKLIEKSIVFSDLHIEDEFSDEGGANYNLETEFMKDFIEKFEEKQEKKKRIRREKRQEKERERREKEANDG